MNNPREKVKNITMTEGGIIGENIFPDKKTDMNNPPKENLRIDWFAEQMKHKLELNRHKGGWEDCKNYYLVRRLLEETAELVQSVMRNADADTVIEEAADVANFCMMIADNRYCGPNKP